MDVAAFGLDFVRIRRVRHKVSERALLKAVHSQVCSNQSCGVELTSDEGVGYGRLAVFAFVILEVHDGFVHYPPVTPPAVGTNDVSGSG